jgi:CRISPR-associated protein Csm4
MNNWKLVKLNFGRSYAHFGELGIGIEETSDRLRSDTLFSAWIVAYARLFGKDAVEELLQQFVNNAPSPPMRISSTFIYRDKGAIYYLPRPLKFPINYPAGDGDLKFFKAYKKLNYLPLEVWQRWYQGEGFTESDRSVLIAETEGKSDKHLNEHLRQAGTFDYKQACKTAREPKIAVDRITRATNLYHTGFVQFQWQQNGNGIESLSGLYFLLYFPEHNPQLEHKLRAALHLLGEEGIGGERSSGAGRFEVEWLPLPEAWQKVVDFSEGNHYNLMSLFWELPLPEEFLNDASYEIQERGGWITGQQLRRKMVRMFAEGSVFRSAPLGKLADVTPRELIATSGEYKVHPIYRSGIGLSLPIRVQD